MTEVKRFLSGGYRGILALMIAFLFAGHCVWAGPQAGPPEEAKFMIFSLNHISVEQGKKYLAEVIEGTVTNPFPGSPTLLVTAQPRELAKAKILLDLVDEPGQFVIRVILPVSAARNIPSNEEIATRLSPSLTRGVSIGSFSKPPAKEAKVKAIIDIHNETVVAVAPPSLMEQITTAIESRIPISGSPGVPASKEPRAQDSPVVQPERKVSQLLGPNEAKFLLTANSGADTEPNAVGNVSEKESASASDASQPYQLPPLVNGEQVVNLNLADREKLTIVEFLGLVGPYLKLDFTYKEKDIDQEFTINPHGKYAGPIKVKDLYPILETILKNANLAMTRSGGNLVTIVPVANTLDIDPTLLEDGATIDRGDGMIQKIFKLEYIETATAKELLEGMKLTTNITEVPETKTLIITAYAYRMPRIQSLLQVVDKPGEPKKFRFRPLQYTMAQTLAPKLQALAEQLGTITITIAADEETSSAPTARPVRKPGESTTEYNAKLRAWSTAQAARARAAAARSRSSSTGQPAETTTPTVYLDADERTNRILMIGLREQLDEVEELIDMLDVAQKDLRSLKLYKVVHVGADEVKLKLEELGIITPRQTSPYGYGSRLTGNMKAPTTPATTAARTQAMTMRMQDETMTETPQEEPQVVVIEQTNSLLVNATAEQHEKIVKIKDYVDCEPEEGDIPVKIYPLENQSPDHLKEVLDPLIQETVMDKEGKAVQEVKKKQPDDQIEIVADPNTFSLIVFASKRNQVWLGDLIGKLDQRRSQVLIDVTLVQINKDDDFNYDLNVLSSFPDLVETSGLTNAIMGATGNNLVSTLTNSRRDRFVDFQSNPGNENPLERGKAFYGDRHINLLLTAMQEKSYGRVLAKPKILVNDNEAGTISTIDKTYVTKTSSIPVSSGGAGQETTLIQTAVDYQDYPAGITLSIVPHISRGDFLRLDITLDRSDFDLRTKTGEKPPDTTTSNIETTVTVPDGSTIILGGLLKLNQNKGGTKIPILGDIPLVGGLFRSTSNSDTQRSLYVFVKAEIIRPPDKDVAQGNDRLDEISRKHRESFEEHEKEFQEYQDWPGIKPKPVQPDKVLDAQ